MRPLKLHPRDLFVEMMEHKEIDHNAAHLQWGNQFLHLVSSIMMLFVYVLLFTHPIKLSAIIIIAAQTMRQGGHFFIEGNATHKEKLKIGYTTRMKQIAVYGVIPLVFATWNFYPPFHNAVDGWNLAVYTYAFLISIRVMWLSFYGAHILQGVIWFVKIVTDMVTDLHLYGPTLWGRTAPKMYHWTKPEDEAENIKKRI